MPIPDGPPHICWGVVPPRSQSDHRLAVRRRLLDGTNVDLSCDLALLDLSPTHWSMTKKIKLLWELFWKLPMCSLNAFRVLKLKVQSITKSVSLAGWLSCLECHTIHQTVVGSVPGQGVYLGCRFDPWLGCLWEAIDGCFSHPCFSLSPSLPLSLSASLPFSLKSIKNKKQKPMYPRVRI